MSESVAEHAPDLFSKIGPLPAWAWGAMVVGGYIVYSHMHASNAAPDSTAFDGTPVDATGFDSSGVDTSGAAGVPLDTSSAGYDYGTVNQGTYTGPIAPTGLGSFSSNQAWAVYMIGWLTAQGYPPSTVTNAITHYLAGASLTEAEAAIISAAIAAAPPPLPLPVNVIPGTSSGGTVGTGFPPGKFPGSPDSPQPAPTPRPIPADRSGGAITVKNHLTATKSGTNHAHLQWTSVPNATSYELWKDGRPVANFGAGTTSFTTAALTKGKHTWWVQAKNATSHLGGNTASVTI